MKVDGKNYFGGKNHLSFLSVRCWKLHYEGEGVLAQQIVRKNSLLYSTGAKDLGGGA